MDVASLRRRGAFFCDFQDHTTRGDPGVHAARRIIGGLR
jgi:hypothetical protein